MRHSSSQTSWSTKIWIKSKLPRWLEACLWKIWREVEAPSALIKSTLWQVRKSSRQTISSKHRSNWMFPHDTLFFLTRVPFHKFLEACGFTNLCCEREAWLEEIGDWKNGLPFQNHIRSEIGKTSRWQILSDVLPRRTNTGTTCSNNFLPGQILAGRNVIWKSH